MSDRRVRLNQKHTHYTARSAGSAASKFGQLIGSAFEVAVVDMIAQYLAECCPNYEIVRASVSQSSALSMFGGHARQVDNIISPVDSDDPIALLETKWLKDGRHHNDKGAWILQLREIRKKYATIRGTAAILIGFWTNEVVVFLMQEGHVEAMVVATDEQVYETLQPRLDVYLRESGLEPLALDVRAIRNKYERAWDLANFIQWLDGRGELLPLATGWLSLANEAEPGLTGTHKIRRALDKFLQPLPVEPRTAHWEITLRIDTGNIIHQEFDDIEEAQEFIIRYSDPQHILERITPRKRQESFRG